MSAAEQLMDYLQIAYMQDTELRVDVIQGFLQKIPPGSMDWVPAQEEGMPALHYACMNESTEPAELFLVITALLMHGADPKVEDADGDTALSAILSLASQEDLPEEEPRTEVQVAAVRALIRSPEQPLDEISGLCSWLRQFTTQEQQNQVLSDLELRLGKEPVRRAWTSQMFLKYLEQCAYEAKKGLKAPVVRQFLEAGADVAATQNGASTLLLMVLNPYTDYAEMREICRMVLEKEPKVVAQRDGFKLSPFDWAADYANIASQHGVRPNPAVLLALLPAILQLAGDELASEAGVCCLKVRPNTSSTTGDATSGKALRFLEGDRVLCRVEAPGGKTTWEEGVVVALWFREQSWPAQFSGAPYEVKLDIGHHVFALADSEVLIRREAKTKKAETAPKAAPQKRFQKQQREDGSWELLDTKSGKARACSPPCSDDEE